MTASAEISADPIASVAIALASIAPAANDAAVIAPVDTAVTDPTAPAVVASVEDPGIVTLVVALTVAPPSSLVLTSSVPAVAGVKIAVPSNWIASTSRLSLPATIES